MKPVIETLEDRLALSAVLKADGTLVVQGTIGSDTIRVLDDGVSLTALVNQDAPAVFPKADVSRIYADGDGGFDVIRYELPASWPGAFTRLRGFNVATTKSTWNATVGGVTLSQQVNGVALVDAYFNAHFQTEGRVRGGGIFEVGTAAQFAGAPPGDATYAELVQLHDEDKANYEAIVAALPPGSNLTILRRRIAAKLDALLA